MVHTVKQSICHGLWRVLAVNVGIAVHANLIAELTAQHLPNRNAVDTAYQIPQGDFYRADAAALTGTAAELLNTAEDLIDVTGIFAQDNALEHLGVQSGRTVTHFAVAADTLVGVDTDDVIDPMSVGTLIDFADLHIRNAQITGTGAGVLDVNVHDWSPPDYFICDVILACKFFFFNTHHSLHLLRND